MSGPSKTEPVAGIAALAPTETPARSCLVCGGRLGSARVPGLLQCVACAFVTADLELSAAEHAHLYGPDYFHGDEYRDYVADERSHKLNFRARLADLARVGAELSISDLFEIGSAYGFFLDEAQKHVRSARGIDISESAAAFARSRLGVDVSSGDYLEHQVGSSVDLICMWDTVEHLGRPDLFVEKAARDLKPGGLLAVTTGDIGSLNARLRGKDWRMIHPPTHLHYFSVPTMRRMLESRGFDVIHVAHPGVSRDLRSIVHFIVGLRMGMNKLYERIAAWPLLNTVVTMNLRDIMFVVARRRT